MIFGKRFRKPSRYLMAMIGLSLGLSGAAVAQSTPEVQETSPSPQQQYRDLINSNTVTVLGASLSGSYIKIVDDIAKAVNDGHNLRVLPIIGEGGSQNIRDILYLKGIDAGIVMSTSLDTYKDKPLFENLQSRLQYIARLYEEEFHVIGGKEIGSIYELDGKKVGFHGGAYVSGQDLLSKLRIKPAEAVKVNFFEGLDQVKSGEIAAIIRATASPMSQFNDKFDPQAHKIIPIPFEDALIESHLPGKLTHEAYPDVIPEGASVDTVAIGVVLAAYPWDPGTERYRRVAKFTRAFFSNIGKLLEDNNRHAKWDDVNLAAELPGWTRFPAAEQWLKENEQTLPRATASLRSEFSTFVQNHTGPDLDETRKEELFREFQKWRESAGR